VGLPVNPGPLSVSLAGVNVNAVGLAESGSGVGSGGGIVIQLGTPPPNLDPFLFAFTNFSHASIPESNLFLNGTPLLVNNSRQYQFGYGQAFLTGTSAQLVYTSYGSSLNSPLPTLNPYHLASLDLFITQNLLQGFSRAVNNRNIRVARNNMKVTDLQLKRQVITTLSSVLNLYWDLVSFNEDVRIKEQTLANSQKLLEDNKHQVDLGTLPAIEVTRAAAEVSSTKEDLLIAQTNVAQQETVLKNSLSRNGVASAWLDDVHIIPLNHIVVPETEVLKPNAELIQQALANRPEVEQTRINLESSRINLAGTKNALMPTLQAFLDLTNNGLTGDPNYLGTGLSGPPPNFLVGGYGNALGQIFKRNFPSYTAGFQLNIAFRNRAAQADYVADQLTLRTSELQLQKTLNQVRVDVKNAVIGLQQDAEQNRFKFGESTIALVVQAQRDLATDQSAEVQAMANYTHAKTAFDEAVGQTLETNSVSIGEAVSGQVARRSSIPDSVPDGKK
jgi:outer membrane protein TolC